MRLNRVRRLVPALLASGSIWLGACATKSINHVLADPQRYVNREVKVHGEVAQSYSVLGHGAYKLRDETGTLWVISHRGVPREGARVEVKGTVRDTFDLGVPAVREAGVVLVERSHETKD